MPPVPEYGPTKNGSGAAWLVERRLLNKPFTWIDTLSVIAKLMRANMDLRSDGVSSRLYGAKLKRSWPPTQLWYVPAAGLALFHTGVVVPSLSVMSYQFSCAASQPP